MNKYVGIIHYFVSIIVIVTCGLGMFVDNAVILMFSVMGVTALANMTINYLENKAKDEAIEEVNYLYKKD